MKVGIRVLGCPKNTADCEVLAGVLKKKGHIIVKSVEEADVVVVDTCTFIEDAKRETIDEILDFVEYKKHKKDLKIVVKGCMVQRYYKELKKEIPEVDAWAGVLPPEKVVKVVEDMKDLVSDPLPVYEETIRESLEKTPYAYVKIADGCDRRCTFCAIPLFKGRYRSRSVEIIEKEVALLVEKGIKEIILVSQDSTAYGTDLYGQQKLPELLKVLSRIRGDFWIRVMYLHPDYLTGEIIDSIANVEKVVPYYEVPVQHGSEKILKRMGRIKGPKELFKLFDRIRKASQKSTIRTTIMVGFPGEGKREFEDLVKFLEGTHPDRMGVFVYSDEEGTVASTFEDKVDKEVAKERQEIILNLSYQFMEDSNKRWIGKTVKGLVEEDEDGVHIRSFVDAPEIDGYIVINGRIESKGFVKVRISNAVDFYMEGEIVG